MGDLEDRANYAAMQALEKSDKLNQKTWWMSPFAYVPLGLGVIMLGVAIAARASVKTWQPPDDKQE